MVSAAFADLVGQPQAVELLTQAIAKNRIAPAYLFVGPAGVGRRLAARAFLTAMLAAQPTGQSTQPLTGRVLLENHPDLLWIEPTYLYQGKRVTGATLLAQDVALPKTRPQVRLEQIRALSRFLSQSPLEAPRFLVVIEGAETMGEAAANGLLKTLEEPGQGTIILMAPAIDALLPTLVSRCQRIPFYRLSQVDLQQVLHRQGQEQILENPYLLGMAQGSPGQALIYWEQIQALSPELLSAFDIIGQRPHQVLQLARQVEKDLDGERQLWLLEYLQQRYWLQYKDAKAIEYLEQAKRYLAQYVQPRLVWEVTLLKLVTSFKEAGVSS